MPVDFGPAVGVLPYCTALTCADALPQEGL
jgi:hypothetical protein